MTRFLLAGGLLAVMMGAALFLPVLVDRLESGGFTTVGIGMVLVGCGLLACGVSAVLVGLRQRPASPMPSGVRAAVAVAVLFLTFFALEFSDGLVRQEGRIFYWTTVLFPPVLLVFWGLLAARRWAWWTFRGATALGSLWFLGFIAIIPFANFQADGVPVPWYGRVYMICVSFAFASVLARAYWSLGRPESRNYFRLGAAA